MPAGAGPALTRGPHRTRRPPAPPARAGAPAAASPPRLLLCLAALAAVAAAGAGSGPAGAQGVTPAGQSATCATRAVSVRFTGPFLALDPPRGRPVPMVSVSRGRWGVAPPCALRPRLRPALAPAASRVRRAPTVLRCALGGPAQVRFARLPGGAVRVQVGRRGAPRAVVDARVGPRPHVRYDARACAAR